MPKETYEDIQKKNGSKGGKSTFKKLGSKHMSRISKNGWKKRKKITTK